MDASREIREARTRAGLTQADLARRSGTSQATLSAYENGRKEPSVSTLTRILGAAGAQLTVAPGPFASNGRVLAEVLELAAALPTRHERTLRFPRLPT
jgi:transcriptional regulator with XRE-family HTH domain